MNRLLPQCARRNGLGRSVAAAAALAGALTLAGCRQDMHDQPKFIPQRGTNFFADGRSVRPQVENTVARGQERFNVYCTPCHSRVGNGEGLIVMRGYRPAGNFHTQRLTAAPLGHFFYVMTNGYGAMPQYAAQVSPEDRWAIVAYIRALQLSQHAQESDAPAGAQFEPLQNIAEREGLPADMAKEWKLPPTAVYGTPNNQDNGIPEPASPNDKSAIGTPAPSAMERPTTPAGPNKQ